ncbi:MAG: FAD binding domain-containing protein [Planctomycetes bacterium]|nr:FAD binding domain-containing protein [Planctomycetota bacterium]
MKDFAYAVPATLARAAALWREAPDASRFLAGGTDLLGMMKDFVIQPARVISLAAIPELRGIREEDGALVIGAMTPLGDVIASPLVRARCPALVQAAAGIKSPQLRNMATLGGDLLQRPRCWYFRRGFGLLGMKDGKSLVLDGEDRFHAILGNAGPAKFASPSSIAPALVAAGAELLVWNGEGTRRMAALDLYRTPEREEESEFSLAGGEILVAVRLPAARPASATCEVRQRKSLDWPVAAASACLDLENGRVAGARLVLGQVAPVPWLVDVTSLLAGKPLDEEGAKAAAEAALKDATPLAGNGYKVQVAEVAARRALLAAAGKAG